MTSKEFSKYVTERVANGESEKQIAAGLGISLENLYRKMAADDEKDLEETE